RSARRGRHGAVGTAAPALPPLLQPQASAATGARHLQEGDGLAAVPLRSGNARSPNPELFRKVTLIILIIIAQCLVRQNLLAPGVSAKVST
ncbi:MAG: hypothetical protein QE285_15060, partial [Aquabacterium sp.]|nr:hypothetical protein [Aquabacterium sp.]